MGWISLKGIVERKRKSPRNERVQALGLATSCSATFRQPLRFWVTFTILGKFCFKLFFTSCDIYQLSEKTSAKFNWFILLSDCVDSSTGPITNASLVLHSCPLGKWYHMIRFTKWRTTMPSWEERADEGAINPTVEFEFY